MSFYGGEFFGGGFHYHEEYYVGESVFFGGEFFDGGFFQPLGAEATTEENVRTGGKGDNAKRRTIFKPTGLPPYRVRKTVEERVQETAQIHREVIEGKVLVEVEEPRPLIQMTMREIDAEIGELLRKKLRTEDEEVMLMLLLASEL